MVSTTSKPEDATGVAAFSTEIPAGIQRFWDTVNDVGVTTARQRADAFESAQSSLTALSRTFEDALRDHQTAVRQATGTDDARAAEDALREARRAQTVAFEEGQASLNKELESAVASSEEETDRQLVAAWAALAGDVGRALVLASETASTPADARVIRLQLQNLVSVVFASNDTDRNR